MFSNSSIGARRRPGIRWMSVEDEIMGLECPSTSNLQTSTSTPHISLQTNNIARSQSSQGFEPSSATEASSAARRCKKWVNDNNTSEIALTTVNHSVRFVEPNDDIRCEEEGSLEDEWERFPDNRCDDSPSVGASYMSSHGGRHMWNDENIIAFPPHQARHPSHDDEFEPYVGRPQRRRHRTLEFADRLCRGRVQRYRDRTGDEDGLYSERAQRLRDLMVDDDGLYAERPQRLRDRVVDDDDLYGERSHRHRDRMMDDHDSLYAERSMWLRDRMIDEDDLFGERSNRHRDRIMDDVEPVGGRSLRNRDRMMNTVDDEPYDARRHQHRHRTDDGEGAYITRAPRRPHPRHVDESEEAYQARMLRPRYRQRIDAEEPPGGDRRRPQFFPESDPLEYVQRPRPQRVYQEEHDQDSDKYASTSSSQLKDDVRVTRRRGGAGEDIIDKESAAARADRWCNLRRLNTHPPGHSAYAAPTPHGRREIPLDSPHAAIPHLAELQLASASRLEHSVSSAGYDASSECRSIIPSCPSDDFGSSLQPSTTRRSRAVLELPTAQPAGRSHNSTDFRISDTLESIPLGSKEIVADRASSSCATDLGSPCVARSVNSRVSNVAIPEGAPISIISPTPSDMLASVTANDGVHMHSTYKSFRRPKTEKSVAKESRDTSSTAVPGDNYDSRSSRLSYECGEDVRSRDGRYGSMASSVLSHGSSPGGYSSASPHATTGRNSGERRVLLWRRSGRDGAVFPGFLPEDKNAQETNEGNAATVENKID